MKINNLEQYYLYIVSQLKKTLQESQKSGFVLGISGGIDSAVMLAILVKNFSKDCIHPFYLTIDHKNELDDIYLLAKTFDITIPVISLRDTFFSLQREINETNPYSLNNFKPKLRALYLYNVALKTNSLVISCMNYSEYYLGYFTKYGDSQGDLFPLSGLSKMNIFKLAHLLKVPQKIINKAPSPGYDQNITDEKELGFSYQDLETYFHDRNQLDHEIVLKIEKQHQKNLHKLTNLTPSLYLKYERKK